MDILNIDVRQTGLGNLNTVVMLLTDIDNFSDNEKKMILEDIKNETKFALGLK